MTTQVNITKSLNNNELKIWLEGFLATRNRKALSSEDALILVEMIESSKETLSYIPPQYPVPTYIPIEDKRTTPAYPHDIWYTTNKDISIT